MLIQKNLTRFIIACGMVFSMVSAYADQDTSKLIMLKFDPYVQSPKNSSGVSLECHRMTHQELAEFCDLDIKRIEEKYTGKILLTFRPVGVPSGRRYAFYIEEFNDEKTYQGDLIVNRLGQFATEEDSLLPSIFILGEDCMNGEPRTLTFISHDDKSKLSLTVQPNLIQAVWDDGASVEMIMCDPDALLFRIVGKGFSPEEEVVIISEKCKGVSLDNRSCDSEGQFSMIFYPGIEGKSGGLGNLTVRRKSTDETRVLKYFWGKDAKKAMMKKFRKRKRCFTHNLVSPR